MNSNIKRIKKLRDKLEHDLISISGSSINGNLENRIFHVSNICFQGIDANVLIGKMRNIAVSNGAACSSALIEPSHVLKAIGLTDDEALASIRFSLGKYNKEDEIEEVIRRFSLEIDKNH